MDRRRALGTAAALLGSACAGLLSPAAQAAGFKALGGPGAFDYAQLKGRARSLAAAPVP